MIKSEDSAIPELQNISDHISYEATGLDLATSLLSQTTGKKHFRRIRKSKNTSVYGVDYSDSRDPKPLGHILQEVFHQNNWHKQIGMYQLLANWEEVAGKTYADHSQPESFKSGILTIRCESTSWAINLRMLASHIVAQINHKFGDGTVNKVVIKGPDTPSWKHGRLSVRDGRGPRDTYG